MCQREALRPNRQATEFRRNGAIGLLLALCISGCQQSPNALRVPRWQLATSDNETETVVLPSTLSLPDLSEGETFELQASVRLPVGLTHGEPTLYIPSYPSLVALTVDGETIPVRGVAWGSTYARRQPHAFDLPESAVRDGHVDLRLTVTHRWPLDREFSTVPRIVPEGETDPESLRLAGLHIILALIVLGGLAVVVTGATVIAVLRRSRRDYAYLAIAAFFVAPFVASESGLSQALGFGLGELSAAALAFSVTVLAMLWFTSRFFDLPRPSHGWTVLAFVPLVVFAHNPDPFSGFLDMARATVVTLSLGVGYILFQVEGLRRQGREGATALLVCMVLVAGFAAPDLAFYAGLPDLTFGARTGIVAVLAFIWFVAFIVVRGEETSIAGATLELSATVQILEKRREQTRAANEDLRRAVIARSARLYAGLAAAAHPAAPPSLENGTELDESYVVGLVRQGRRPFRSYEATRLESDERCWLTPLAGASGSSFAGLIEDLRALMHMNDPHIGRVARVDIAPEGFVYVDADQVPGVTVADFAKSHPSLADRFSVLAQGARGLATLHAHSLCHRVISEHTLFVHRRDHDLVAIWVDVALSPRFRLARRAGIGEPVDSVPSDAPPANDDSLPTGPQTLADATGQWLPGVERDDVTPMSTPNELSDSASDSGDLRDLEAELEESFESFDTLGSDLFALDAGDDRTMPGGPRAAYVLAPELRTRTQRFTPAADVFAFARLAVTLLADVFEEDEARVTYSGFVRQDFARLSAALDSLRAALDADPLQRPDATELALVLEAVSPDGERVRHDAAGNA